MTQEKRCPHCNQWSRWNGHIEDKCNHCSEYLKLAEKLEIATKEENSRKMSFNFKEKFPLAFKDTDHIIIKVLKKILYSVYFVFMSIMITILWIVFWIVT